MNELITNLIIFIFSFCPLKRKKILFFSYYGSQYGCNPKYISEYIQDNSNDYDIVWAFNTPERYSIGGIRKVRYYSLSFFYELCTAKFIVTNYRMPLFFRKRKRQIYIQTWHSSLRLKTIEKDAESKLTPEYVKMAKHDSKAIDCLLSGCRYSTDIFKSSFWYDGFILECGTPRNDLFFTQVSNIRKKIDFTYSISEHTRIVLYAPTFRKDYSLDYYNIDYTKLVQALSARFGGEWTVLVRLHPHLQQYSRQLLAESNVFDATSYDDIQELLAASDIIISDYSSLMFDFSLTGRPCFLYLPDLEEYTRNDRRLYFDIKKLPYIKAYSNDDLIESIKLFDETNYRNDLIDFNSQIGSFENGTSCQQILYYINNKC
ncbi:CDP-glycerol glycerophosphotransferase family protein [Bacteroides sp. ET336]|uniref:CDP-glycerol glycerophosphotransferase family protein n=1 Tax=Bacteroides sp. ET336 TaxID=2972459 RepID=UPI0021ABF207|nr:CDP-glycerol glycerophosphotransferase family protein [Bacteroides sp. ET336]MCR8893814.1 CDP-glycerol glycerophosphotransferase family protein [Bacteroides sp. ET336]MDN0058311.1 CDP-glycerol glycerophosphotransferase family protein [Bacteroides caecigallinarum]